MRRALALVSVAVTTMIALAFLIPLGLMVRETAREQAMSQARQQAAALAPVLATTEDTGTVARAAQSTSAGQAGRVGVHLPSGAVIGESRVAAGESHGAMRNARAAAVPVAGGLALLQPIALSGGRTAMAEVYVPSEALSAGVVRSWVILGGVGVVLVAASVVVADRLGARVVRSTRRLADAASALGGGDLEVRVRADGPRELVEAAAAFNLMATQVRQLLHSEREMIADLSHRLRTPLTALRLNVEALGSDPAAEQARDSMERLEKEVDAVIASARLSAQRSSEGDGCDAAEVLSERLEFWSVLAEDQQRRWELRGVGEPVRVPVPRTDLVAAVDALISNVFRYTPEQTEFAVSLQSSGGVVGLVVEDSGEGIDSGAAALRRGHSDTGSTGLGLDIARRVAESTGGGISVDRSSFGGARVRMSLWQQRAARIGDRRRRHARK